MKLASTVIVSWILCSFVTNLVAAEPEKVPVFPAGMDGVKLYRIPGLVVTNAGTVLAYCEARRNSQADWGEIEVHLRRSGDGGRSWEPPQHIAHQGERIEGNPAKSAGGEHEQTVNNPVAIVDRQSDVIHMLYCVNYARCFAMHSRDDGKTWSTPREITSVFEAFRSRYDWKVIATGPGHGIQLRGGRFVVPIWLAYGKSGAHAPSASATIYSDDHGQTWQAGDIAVPNEGDFGNPNETVATELSDGRVMLISRNVSKANRKLITHSSNGYSLWSTPLFHSQLLEPICMTSVISNPAEPRVLYYSGPETVARDVTGNEVPAGRGKRQRLTIKVSRDDGQTWSSGRLLEAGPSAYSDLAISPHGQLLCLYEGNATIELAILDRDWMEQGE